MYVYHIMKIFVTLSSNIYFFMIIKTLIAAFPASAELALWTLSGSHTVSEACTLFYCDSVSLARLSYIVSGLELLTWNLRLLTIETPLKL